MRNGMASLAACALLWGSAYADDRPSAAPIIDKSRPDGTVKVNAGSPATRSGYKWVRREIKEDGNRSSNFPVYEASILDGVAAEWLALQKFSAFAGSNAAVGSGPASGRMHFLWKKEHDAAIKLLTTNVTLELKPSAEGVHLILAF